jgi:hypothetical protein
MRKAIRESLKKIMSDGEANACSIWKGYDNGTGRTGWHIVKFGETATYYGKSVEEVIEAIDDIYDSRESA